MASNFTNFIVKLDEDPQLLEDFKKNPDAVMIAEGLTPAERALLVSGDAKLIRSAIIDDPGHKEAMGISPDLSFKEATPEVQQQIDLEVQQQIDKKVQLVDFVIKARDAAFNRISSEADSTRKQLEGIYEQGQTQARRWSLFSLFAAILGYLVIIVGIIVVLTLNTAVGLITSAAGIIPEVAAALFFQQASGANKRLDTISDKLLEVEKTHRAYEIALTVDGTLQNHLKEVIMLRILDLPVEPHEDISLKKGN